MVGYLCGKLWGPFIHRAPRQSPFLAVSVAPNPFNPTTAIDLELAEPARIRVEVFDGQGDSGRPLPSGTDLVRVDGGTASALRRVTLIK